MMEHLEHALIMYHPNLTLCKKNLSFVKSSFLWAPFQCAYYTGEGSKHPLPPPNSALWLQAYREADGWIYI